MSAAEFESFVISHGNCRASGDTLNATSFRVLACSAFRRLGDRVDALVLENQALQDRIDELTEANLRLALQLPGCVKTAILSEPRTYGLEGPDGKGYPYG